MASSAGSPSGTTTSHSSRQRGFDRAVATPTTTKAGWSPARRCTPRGAGAPSSSVTSTAPLRSGGKGLRSSSRSASALRSSRIARRYPAALCETPDASAGRPAARWRSPGSPDEPLGPPAGLVERRRGAWPVRSPASTRWPCWASAPRSWACGVGAQPAAAGAAGCSRARTAGWPCPCPVTRTWRPCRPGSSSTSPPGDGARPPGPPSPDALRDRDPRRAARSGPRCSGSPWPAWARRSGTGRGGAPRSLGAAAARDPADLVVVDLSALWAGPLCGDLLAARRRTVVKVESTQPTRRRPPRPACVLRPVERAQAIGRPRLRATRASAPCTPLVRRADVVIEASRPRALEQLGIGPRRDRAGRRPAGLGLHHRVRASRARRPTGSRSATTPPRRADWSPGPERGRCSAATPIADPLTGLTAADACLTSLESGGAGSSTCPWRP